MTYDNGQCRAESGSLISIQRTGCRPSRGGSIRHEASGAADVLRDMHLPLDAPISCAVSQRNRQWNLRLRVSRVDLLHTIFLQSGDFYKGPHRPWTKRAHRQTFDETPAPWLLAFPQPVFPLEPQNRFLFLFLLSSQTITYRLSTWRPERSIAA